MRLHSLSASAPRVSHAREYAKLFWSGGAVAQLGARLDGIEEVEGSNPFGSTIFQFFHRLSQSILAYGIL